jgi:hypothetical protein
MCWKCWLKKKKRIQLSDVWALGQWYMYPRMIYVHANKRKARINGIICAATTIPRIEKFQPAAADVHNAEKKIGGEFRSPGEA